VNVIFNSVVWHAQCNITIEAMVNLPSTPFLDILLAALGQSTFNRPLVLPLSYYI